MRVLIDISHPAHVHFYRHLHARILASGGEVLVVARDKDVTIDLLKAFEIPHLVVGRSGHRNMAGQLVELLSRDLFLVRKGMRFRPDLVLTRNPTGVHAARAIGAIGIFDTDDGRAVGVHYRAAAPFAQVITAPDSLPESFGRKGRKYPSYKSLAYLHPDLYTPSPNIRQGLGIEEGERFSVLRLVAHDASHDRHARGIDKTSLDGLVRVLAQQGKVFVSAEGGIPDIPQVRQLQLPPERIHDVLAAASLVVGDSQTVITEAALLGTPAVRINTWAKSSPHLTELEMRYGLVMSFLPEELDGALRAAGSLLEDASTQSEWELRRERMLSDKVNLTDWYFSLVLELAER